LWLIKVWFSSSTFVVKIATFAKPETVMGKLNSRHTIKHPKDNLDSTYKKFCKFDKQKWRPEPTQKNGAKSKKPNE
jgi:hypothetical protein